MGRIRQLITAMSGAGLLATALIATTASAITPDKPEFKSDVLNALNITGVEIRSIDLQANERGIYHLTLPIEGIDVSVEIWPHSIRSEHYRVLKQVDDGSLIEVEPSPESTYRGIVSEIPGANVAASVIDNQLFAMVSLPDNSRFWVEPLGPRFPGIDGNLHAVYRQDDVIPSLGSCGVVDSMIQQTEAIRDRQQGSIEAGSGDCGGMCVAEFGADADFEFYQAFGSNVQNVENVINNIMNSVNTLYENQVGITHQITGIIVRTAEPDPYSSTNAGTLLGEFRTHWQQVVGNSIPHDTAQLFTGKNLNGSTIGIAYLSGVCTSLKYSVAQTTCCGSFSCRTDLTAHELGHNWSSEHHSGSNSTMNASLTCANNFITPSRNAIISFRNSRNCLSPLPPASAPGLFFINSPAPGATDVVRNPQLQWSAAEFAAFYRVSLADNPEFTAPKINQFSTSNTFLNTPNNFLDEGVTYYWKVTAFNSAGETPSSPSISIFTVFAPNKPEPCPGDANGDGAVDLADLNLVLANFGSTTSDGDVNGDGVVDLADLNLVLANFGTTCP